MRPEKTLVKNYGENATDRVIKLLIQDSHLSISEMAKQTGKSHIAAQRALNKLRESGSIEYNGPAKGGHWIVKEKP